MLNGGEACVKRSLDSSGEMRLRLERVALVKGSEALEGVASHLHTLVFSQNGACETGSLHLQHLVHEHIAKGPDVGLEVLASSEHDRLRKRTPVGELGEVELNALNALKVHLDHIDVVAQVQGLKAIGTDKRGVGGHLGACSLRGFILRGSAEKLHGFLFQMTVGSCARTYRASLAAALKASKPKRSKQAMKLSLGVRALT